MHEAHGPEKPGRSGTYLVERTNNALSYMSVEEASKFSQAYTVQTVYLQTQWLALTAYSQLRACMPAKGIERLPMESLPCIEQNAREVIGKIILMRVASDGLERVYAEALGEPAPH